MYRGYLAICHPEEQQLSFIERLVEMASSLAIREWRRLPHVVSHVHTPLLQVGTAPSLPELSLESLELQLRSVDEPAGKGLYTLVSSFSLGIYSQKVDGVLKSEH